MANLDVTAFIINTWHFIQNQAKRDRNPRAVDRTYGKYRYVQLYIMPLKFILHMHGSEVHVTVNNINLKFCMIVSRQKHTYISTS